MRITYMADDGKMFDTQEECEHYESGKCNMIDNFPSCWDVDGDYINDRIGRDLYDQEDVFHRAQYMRVKNANELAALDMLYEIYGLAHDGINGIGCYYFDSYDNVWRDLQEEVNNKVAVLSRMLNGGKQYGL